MNDNLISLFNKYSAFELLEYFPWFGEGFIYIDSRLHIYCSDTDWTVLIEVINDNPQDLGHNACLETVYMWDTKQHKGGLCKPIYYNITSDGDDGAVFSDFELNNVKNMSIRERLIPIPDKTVYDKKNIQITSIDEVQQYEILRALTPEYRDAFFMREDDILKLVGVKMSKLLQLEEWRHPLVYDDGTYEHPVECEVFQLIDKVIEYKDPSMYRPTEEPNTHWSNWTSNDYL